MVAEIPLEELDRYVASFPGPHLALVLGAVAAGHTSARLWACAQAGEPPTLLLWDQGNNVLYLSGRPAGEAGLGQVAELIARQIRPQALAQGAPHFKVQALDPALEPRLGELFAGAALHAAPSFFYAYPAQEASPALPPGIAGLAIVAIERALLQEAGLRNSEQVRAELQWMWPSEERFYAHGFGSAAIMPGEIVCWCTAEYLSADRCGLGIATAPAHQRRGVATATAAHAVAAALARGVRPHWECGQSNGASIRVAEKVGFVRVAEERYWAGTFT